jgi:hypothetical protein
MRLDRVVRQDRDTRPRRRERAGHVRVLPERRCADDEHDVVRLQRLAQAGPVSGKVPGELRVVAREPGLPAERLLPHGSAEPLGERYEGSPALRVVRAGPGDERGALRVPEHRDQGVHRGGVGCRGSDDRAGRGLVGAIVRRCQPVVHRRDHERRAACGRRLVPGAADGTGKVLGPDRVVDPDGILAGEALEPTRQERLVSEVAPILLTHEHDERRPVDACRREGAHGIAEARRRVENRERGRRPAERIPRGHPDHGALVEPEHEVEIVRKGREEGHFGRARVREHLREAPLAKDVEDGITDR